MKNKKCMCIAGSPKIMVQSVLNWLFYRIEAVNNVSGCCGHDGNGLNLKTSGRFFQGFTLVSQIKSVKN